MRPEEYRHIIKSLETHFEEFKVSSQGSRMISDEDKKSMEHQVNGAQTHYEQLVVQLPVYGQYNRQTKKRRSRQSLAFELIANNVFSHL